MRVSQDTVSWDNHELSESRGTRNRQSSIICAASNIISALKLWNQNIRFCFDSGHFWSTELSILNLYRLMVSILSNFHCLIFSLLLNFALGWNKELRYKVTKKLLHKPLVICCNCFFLACQMLNGKERRDVLV